MYFELKDKAESPIENIFLKDCITIGLVVAPQVKIGKYRVDFFIPEKKLIIEVDGKDWHNTTSQIARDNERDWFLMWEKGLRIIRITGSAVFNNGENIAADIKGFMNSEEFIDNRIGWWKYE